MNVRHAEEIEKPMTFCVCMVEEYADQEFAPVDRPMPDDADHYPVSEWDGISPSLQFTAPTPGLYFACNVQPDGSHRHMHERGMTLFRGESADVTLKGPAFRLALLGRKLDAIIDSALEISAMTAAV